MYSKVIELKNKGKLKQKGLLRESCLKRSAEEDSTSSKKNKILKSSNLDNTPPSSDKVNSRLIEISIPLPTCDTFETKEKLETTNQSSVDICDELKNEENDFDQRESGNIKSEEEETKIDEDEEHNFAFIDQSNMKTEFKEESDSSYFKSEYFESELKMEPKPELEIEDKPKEELNVDSSRKFKSEVKNDEKSNAGEYFELCSDKENILSENLKINDDKTFQVLSNKERKKLRKKQGKLDNFKSSMVYFKTRMAELDAKEKKVSARYGFSCKICGVVYRQKEIAFYHAWYKHYIDLYHPAKSDLDTLEDEDIVRCIICNSFCSVHDHDAHVLFHHHMKKDIWIPCGQCGSTFNHFEAYVNHMIGHAKNLPHEQLLADLEKVNKFPQLGRKEGDKMERSLFYANKGKKSKEKSKSSTVNEFNNVALNPVVDSQANIASSKNVDKTNFLVPSSPSPSGSRFHHSSMPRFPPPSPRTLISRRTKGYQF